MIMSNDRYHRYAYYYFKMCIQKDKRMVIHFALVLVSSNNVVKSNDAPITKVNRT